MFTSLICDSNFFIVVLQACSSAIVYEKKKNENKQYLFITNQKPKILIKKYKMRGNALSKEKRKKGQTKTSAGFSG